MSSFGCHKAPDPVADIEAAGRRSRGDQSGVLASLVDDAELVRAATTAMLQGLGYAVREATSTEEALKLIESGPRMQLLVSDYLMPGMTGRELAQRVIAARPGTRALILSDYAVAEGIGATFPRLTKPFQQAELAGKLQEIIQA